MEKFILLEELLLRGKGLWGWSLSYRRKQRRIDLCSLKMNYPMKNGKLVKADLNREFFSMRNHAFRNRDLSFKAMGLLAFMLQTPPGWEFSISGLSACAKDGSDSVGSGLNELKDQRYLFCVVMRNDRGHFERPEYHISDIPFPDDYLSGVFEGKEITFSRGLWVVRTETGFPGLGKSGSGKSGQYSIDLNNYLFNPSKGGEEIENLEGLPPDERMIRFAIHRAKQWFVKWPVMKDQMPINAKIVDPDFDFWSELEKWIRHNAGNLPLMTNPGKSIPSGFQSWLNRYNQFKPKNDGKEFAKSRNNKHLISQDDARNILTELDGEDW